MEPTHVSKQEQREHADPHEQAMSIPIPILILVACMIIFGIFYILASDASTAPEYGDQRTMKDLMAKSAAAPGDKVDGAAVYTARCGAKALVAFWVSPLRRGGSCAALMTTRNSLTSTEK